MMALKKVSKLQNKTTDNEIADAGADGAEGTGKAKVKKARAPGGRKSGRTWVIPRKRAEVIVQLAGNAGQDKLNELLSAIDLPEISVNNAANIKYARSQIAKKPEAYKHRGTQQFDRLAYAIAHKESALTNETLIELGLVPENDEGELMYDLVAENALGPVAEPDAEPDAEPVETEKQADATDGEL